MLCPYSHYVLRFVGPVHCRGAIAELGNFKAHFAKGGEEDAGKVGRGSTRKKEGEAPQAILIARE